MKKLDEEADFKILAVDGQRMPTSVLRKSDGKVFSIGDAVVYKPKTQRYLKRRRLPRPEVVSVKEQTIEKMQVITKWEVSVFMQDGSVEAISSMN